MDTTAIRERYVKDTLPVRLGGLAANLLRVKSFCRSDANESLVASVIDESKMFIEWTAPEAEPDVAAELVELQVQLARWQQQWANIWADTARRHEVATTSGDWSTRVLTLSGLLDAAP